ncbi:Hypothetical protein CINCED_3A008407 [Cinara cedri]|uniref:Uncharacterized protein n=1 Tax=Cinara cedri TaxID=506608 RepID=A0A5E4MRN5_9HEMI|nr:Hypothetical protein CINCED_3A008407 [Cinara cedri]
MEAHLRETKNLIKLSIQWKVMSTLDLPNKKDAFQNVSNEMFKLGFCLSPVQCRKTLIQLIEDYKNYQKILPFINEMEKLMYTRIEKKRNGNLDTEDPISTMLQTMNRNVNENSKLNQTNSQQCLDLIDSMMKIHQKCSNDILDAQNKRNTLIMDIMVQYQASQNDVLSNHGAKVNETTSCQNMIDSMTKNHQKCIRYILEAEKHWTVTKIDIMIQYQNSQFCVLKQHGSNSKLTNIHECQHLIMPIIVKNQNCLYDILGKAYRKWSLHIKDLLIEYQDSHFKVLTNHESILNQTNSKKFQELIDSIFKNQEKCWKHIKVEARKSQKTENKSILSLTSDHRCQNLNDSIVENHISCIDHYLVETEKQWILQIVDVILQYQSSLLDL